MVPERGARRSPEGAEVAARELVLDIDVPGCFCEPCVHNTCNVQCVNAFHEDRAGSRCFRFECMLLCGLSLSDVFCSVLASGDAIQGPLMCGCALWLVHSGHSI